MVDYFNSKVRDPDSEVSSADKFMAKIKVAAERLSSNKDSAFLFRPLQGYELDVYQLDEAPAFYGELFWDLVRMECPELSSVLHHQDSIFSV